MYLGDLDVKERNWAMYAHLSSFLGWIGVPLGNILGPLIIWQIRKEDMPFAAQQAKECLNFQITIIIAGLVAFVLCFFLIGFLIIPVIWLVNVLFTIIAAVRAHEGESYRYPFNFRFIQ